MVGFGGGAEEYTGVGFGDGVEEYTDVSSVSSGSAGIEYTGSGEQFSGGGFVVAVLCTVPRVGTSMWRC